MLSGCRPVDRVDRYDDATARQNGFDAGWAFLRTLLPAYQNSIRMAFPLRLDALQAQADAALQPVEDIDQGPPFRPICKTPASARRRWRTTGCRAASRPTSSGCWPPSSIPTPCGRISSSSAASSMRNWTPFITTSARPPKPRPSCKTACRPIWTSRGKHADCLPGKGGQTPSLQIKSHSRQKTAIADKNRRGQPFGRGLSRKAARGGSLGWVMG